MEARMNAGGVKFPWIFILLLGVLGGLSVLLAGGVGVREAAPPLVPPGLGTYDPRWWTRERLEDVGWTRHALEDHPERAWGAMEIWTLMALEHCRPLHVYLCAKTQQAILTCPYPGVAQGLQVGLVVGLNGGPVVVTGYPGQETYWMGNIRSQSCAGPFLMP